MSKSITGIGFSANQGNLLRGLSKALVGSLINPTQGNVGRNRSIGIGGIVNTILQTSITPTKTFGANLTLNIGGISTTVTQQNLVSAISKQFSGITLTPTQGTIVSNQLRARIYWAVLETPPAA